MTLWWGRCYFHTIHSSSLKHLSSWAGEMVLKGEGTNCRMAVFRKYRTSYTSWIDQWTLSLSMWLQALLSFLTWFVPLVCYHCLIPRASRGLAVAWKSVLACMKMDLHLTAVYSKNSSKVPYIEQLLPSCWAAHDLIIRYFSLSEEFEVHEIHNQAIGCLLKITLFLYIFVALFVGKKGNVLHKGMWEVDFPS